MLGAVHRPIGDRLCQLGGLLRIGRQRADDIDPVKRVQMVEMDHMILNILNAHDDVADQAGVVRNLDLQRIFDGADTGH